MKKNHQITFLVAIVLIITLGCNISGTPQGDDQSAFSTAVAQTSQAQFIQMTMQAGTSPAAPTAIQPTVPQPTAIPPTAIPPTVPAPTAVPPTAPPPDVFAPDPLGPAWSGMAFNSGTCYDLDVLFTAADATVDVCLDNNVLMTPMNGSTFSGYADLSPPSLNTCRAKAFSADPIAPNSDLYMCFQTNAGSYGFFVMRDDQMLSSGYIVFDAYLFP